MNKAQELNIIGDIGGNYLTLMSLLEKMPKSAMPFSIGDMIDRGPRSKEVVDFFMKNGDALMGNHEHMFLDLWLEGGIYAWQDYFGNGGLATIESYMPGQKFYNLELLPRNHMAWLSSLPQYKTLNGLFLSHAPKSNSASLKELRRIPEHQFGLLWNRHDPAPFPSSKKLQVFGHNAMKDVKRYVDQNGREYAVCIDTSFGRKLTGMHWPSGEIFQQDFID